MNHHNKYNSGFFYFLFCFTLLLAIAPAKLRAEEKNLQHILVLHSYHPSLWTDEINSAITDVFENREKSDIHIEYMDTKRINTEPYLDALAEIYSKKWQPDFFDVVITSDDNALNFALKHRSTLFSEAAITFCGVNRYKPEIAEEHPYVTGVVEQGDYESTLNWILTARPQTRRIIFINDDTTTGRINRDFFGKILSEYYPNIQMVDTATLTVNELINSLSSADNSTIAFFNSFWRDGENKAVSTQKLESIFRQSSIPILGRSEWMINRGMLGGMCVSGYRQGETAAHLAEQYLDGVAITELPVITDSPNIFLLDYTELKRHNLHKSLLPAEAVVVNKAIRAEKKKYLFPIVGFFLLLICFVLIIMAIHRRIALIRAKKSASRFRRIIDSFSDAMVIHDIKTGEVLDVNTKLLKLFLADREWVLSHTIGEMSLNEPPYTQKEAMQYIAEAAQGIPQVFEWHARRKDGSLFWAEVNMNRISLPEGERIIVGIRDITARRDRGYIWEVVFNLSTDLYCVTDARSLKFIHVNPGWSKALGYEIREIVGKTVNDFLHPDDMEKTKKQCEKLMSGKLVDSYTNRYQAKDGSWHTMLWSNGAIYENDRIYAVARDITDERRMQEELQQAQKMESIGRLAGGVAHDFNNMLAGIMGSSDLLSRRLSQKSENEQALLNIIKQSAERAAELTQQLLAIGRKTDMKQEPLDMNDIALQVINILSRTIDRRIKLESNLSTKPMRILGDQGSIHSAILNLGVNARDELDSGGVITFTTTDIFYSENDILPPGLTPGHYARLDVQDTGPGVEPDVAERIFDPFFTTKEVGRGTGLGLSAAYASIKAHQGLLSLEPGLGRGATFSIFLPYNSSELMAEESVQHATPTTPFIGEGSVLLVDDEETIRLTVAAMLEDFGYDVFAVADGPAAIEAVKGESDRFCLAIIDLIMPRMTGHDTVKNLSEIRNDLPVIIHSGYDLSGGNAEELVTAGKVSGFIKKPYTRKQLEEALRAAVGDKAV